jgi:uncharacterized membrane protein YsdA (DUF1294 family)
LIIALSIYVGMSAITFIAFGLDKRAARSQHRAWRTPEAGLHILELLGGFPGALLGQQIFRHKTRKIPYLITLWMIIALHGMFWFWWFAR